MGTTDKYAIPFPEATDTPYVHLDLKAQAEAVEAALRLPVMQAAVTKTGGYSTNQWVGMPLGSEPVAGQTSDPTAAFQIDAPNRRVLAATDGLYLITSRIVVADTAGGTPNMAQRLQVAGATRSDARMDSTLGAVTLTTTAIMRAGEAVQVQTFRYGGSSDAQLEGFIHLTRLARV